MNTTQLTPLADEFAEVDLGDARLNKRLIKIADAAGRAPQASLPRRAGTAAELEGTYRLLTNERVKPDAVLKPHVQATLNRAKSAELVLVLHDTTKFTFDGAHRREGLGWINHTNTQGFFGHFSFCVRTDGLPLGTLNVLAWSRQNEPKRQRSQHISQSDPTRESLRWQDSALDCSELLAGYADAIHVMDREGDSVELLSIMLEQELRFIVRVAHNRRLELGTTATENKLFAALSSAPVRFEREVAINRRAPHRSPKGRKTFPARPARTTTLEVRAQKVEVFLTKASSKHLPESLELNALEVSEPAPPEGEAPVTWRLFTTEPIGTDAEVAAIIDAYRKRWIIEELFKALKTGCRYQERQLLSIKPLLVDLAIEVPIAWRMLSLRWLASKRSDDLAETVLTQRQLDVLPRIIRAKGREISDHPTVSEALAQVGEAGEVASLGVGADEAEAVLLGDPRLDLDAVIAAHPAGASEVIVVGDVLVVGAVHIDAGPRGVLEDRDDADLVAREVAVLIALAGGDRSDGLGHGVLLSALARASPERVDIHASFRRPSKSLRRRKRSSFKWLLASRGARPRAPRQGLVKLA
jgi:hypothetical protein